MTTMRFVDRRDAGLVLAEKLDAYAGRDNVLVLALPRGGVPVGYEVAKRLRCPLDVFVVRKLGVPGYEELAMGAIASGGTRVLSDDLIEQLGISEEQIEHAANRETLELARREKLYRDDRPLPPVSRRTVILVDDGLATGATMKAAALALKQLKPQRLIIAVPVAAAETCEELSEHVDEIVCARTPWPFYGVGRWYDDFSQTTDDEVVSFLQRANATVGGQS